MKITLAMVALACLTVSAYAQGSPESNSASTAEENAAMMRNNQEIVAKTPGAEGVFIVRQDGVKHIQSGLICPPFPNVVLSQTKVFPSARKGESVSCDYTRTGKTGVVDSTLSLMVTKADPDSTGLRFSRNTRRN